MQGLGDPSVSPQDVLDLILNTDEKNKPDDDNHQDDAASVVKLTGSRALASSGSPFPPFPTAATPRPSMTRPRTGWSRFRPHSLLIPAC